MNLITISSAQRTIIDAAPAGKQNYLPVQGGSIKISIDTISKLDDLINKLVGDWKFIDTWKMYWIGYTSDMFSIASRKNSAIRPLLHFIDTSKNLHARLGAVYSLHLIGINSEIKGRTYEEFNNPEAREALLSLLKYSDLQPTIIELLIRDRHLSDVPKIFEALSSTNSDCWALNNYLTQFSLPLPINQEIPNTFNDDVSINYTKDLHDNFQEQLPIILNAISESHLKKIEIDKELLNSAIWGPMRHNLIGSYESLGQLNLPIKNFLYGITEMDYTNIGSKLQYYLQGDKIYICTQSTAKQRLVEWWKKLSSEEKGKFKDGIKMPPLIFTNRRP